MVIHGEVAVEGQQVQQLLEQVALGRAVQGAAASLRVQQVQVQQRGVIDM